MGPGGDDDGAIAALGRMVLFADLSRPELHEIHRVLEEEYFDEGRRVVRQGIGGSNFYVIVDGEAEISRSEGMSQRLRPGDFFGDDALLLDEAPRYDVTAVTGVTCLVLRGDRFEKFMIEHPQVMFRMLQSQALKRSGDEGR